MPPTVVLYAHPTDRLVPTDWFPTSLLTVAEGHETRRDERVAPGRPLCTITDDDDDEEEGTDDDDDEGTAG